MNTPFAQRGAIFYYKPKNAYLFYERLKLTLETQSAVLSDHVVEQDQEIEKHLQMRALEQLEVIYLIIYAC